MFYELRNYWCLGMGQISRKYLTEEKMDRTHLAPFLSVGSSLLPGQCVHSSGQTTGFVAVLYMIKVMRWHGRTKSDRRKPSFNSSVALWNRLSFLYMEIQVEKVA